MIYGIKRIMEEDGQITDLEHVMQLNHFHLNFGRFIFMIDYPNGAMAQQFKSINFVTTVTAV